MNGRALKIIIVAIIALVAVGSAAVFIVPSDSHRNGGDSSDESIDYGYLYEGFYLDIADTDHMLTSYAKNDGTNGLYCITSAGETKEIRMYADQGRTEAVMHKFPVQNILRSEDFSIIMFLANGSGTLTEMQKYAKAYSELHPELTGFQPIPSYWVWAQYYWMDNETGQLHYLPIESTLYDFDNDVFSTMNYTSSNLLGISDNYLYYSSISNINEFDGVFRIRVVDGIVDNQKLFDRDIFELRALTKNDILVASDAVLLPDGKKIDVPQGYKIVDRTLCVNVEYLDVYIQYEYKDSAYVHGKEQLLVDYYPISADCMQDDGSFTHRDFTMSESVAIAERKAYRDSSMTISGKSTSNSSNLFDIVNHRYYKITNIIDYTTLVQNGPDYYVSVQTLDLGEVNANYYNIYIISEGSSLFLVDILSGKKTLVSDDLYKITSMSYSYSNCIELTYSDNQYTNHTVFVLPDGTFSQEVDARYWHIFV